MKTISKSCFVVSKFPSIWSPAQGADIEAEDVVERTPLHAAAENAELHAVELLLQKGAHADKRDARGLTPIDLLVKHDCRCRKRKEKEEKEEEEDDEEGGL